MTSTSGAPRGKNRGLGTRAIRGQGSTITSNVVLSTIGSLHADEENPDVELDDMHFEIGMGYSGDSSKTLDNVDSSPAPAYNTIEMGYHTARRSEECGVSGIRIDVEKTTTTM